MQYMTACYRQQGEAAPSLLLSQFQCREVPVCLAYLADGNHHETNTLNAGSVDELRFWCRHFPWPKAVKRPGRWLARAEKELAERLAGSAGDAPCYTLLLAVGEHLLLMGGGQPVYLINTSYGQGHAELLQPDFRGVFEAGAGILLATPAFAENLRPDRLGKALCPGELKEEAQMERRLRELAEEAQMEGRLREPAEAAQMERRPRGLAEEQMERRPREPAEEVSQETEPGGDGGAACRMRVERKPVEAAVLLVARESC